MLFSSLDDELEGFDGLAFEAAVRNALHFYADLHSLHGLPTCAENELVSREYGQGEEDCCVVEGDQAVIAGADV